MINEISLRTNKSEYNSGEEIYGVVYLRIITPTKGRGIRVCFKGYEEFCYQEKHPNGEYEVIQDHRDYMNYKEVLYQSDEPLSMCNTLFPFKIPLSTEIPGTFHTSKETENYKWKAKVEYLLVVEVIDASQSLSVKEKLCIHQPLCRGVLASDPTSAISAKYERTRALFFQHVINVTARLHNHVHRTGENLKLRLIVSNNSNVNVQSVKLQLERTLSLITRKKKGEDNKPSTSICVQTLEDNDKLCLCVETREPVGQDQIIDMTHFQKGLDSIQIPLKDVDGSPVIPSVRGQHIKCEYEVFIIVHLTNGDTFDLRVPVSVIVAEGQKHWRDWSPPVWLTDDKPEVHCSSDSIFMVPENLLRSAAFAGIPGFQPL